MYTLVHTPMSHTKASVREERDLVIHFDFPYKTTQHMQVLYWVISSNPCYISQIYQQSIVKNLCDTSKER